MSETIPQFSRAEGGLVMKSDGLNPVQDWNGVKSAFENSGVPAPTAAITLAADGVSGDIAGRFYAYQRWLDSEGNVSNVSPVSSELVIAVSTGSVTAATNASPISVTSATHGLSTNDIISIENVVGNTAANGVWTITKVDSNIFTLNSSNGNADYISGGTWSEGTDEIDYTGITVPTDSRVVKRQILRTRSFGSSVVYVDVEDTTLSGTSFSSSKSDAALTSPIPLTGTNGEDLEINRRGEPPNFKPFMAHSNGRMFAWGNPIYRAGAVAVTNASTTVTGVGTAFTASMAGRILFVVGDTSSYTISAVNTSTQVLTLSANFTGTTGAFAQYSIQEADAERLSLYWSSSGLPEDWNVTDDTIALQEDYQSGEPTGMMALDRRVFQLFENRIQMLAFDVNPSTDSYRALGPKRGCINNRCWVVNDSVAYMLDRQGIYMFDGGNKVTAISESIQDLFQQGSDSPYQIKWEFAETFHACLDIERERVKFFVSLGDRYPRHSINYTYSQGRQQFDIEEYPFAITSSVLARIGGRWKPVLGAMGKRMLSTAQGHLDGSDVDEGTVRGSVTSSGLTWIEDTSASFASSGLIGWPIHIVSGPGKGQQRLIESVSGTKVFVDQPWLEIPTTDSKYQIGGIKFRFRGGWHRFADSDKYMPRAIELVYEPLASTAEFDVRLFRDRSKTPQSWFVSRESDGVTTEEGSAYLSIDTTKDNGFVRHVFDAHRLTDIDGPRYVSVELSGVTNGERIVIYSMDVTNVS